MSSRYFTFILLMCCLSACSAKPPTSRSSTPAATPEVQSIDGEARADGTPSVVTPLVYDKKLDGQIEMMRRYFNAQYASGEKKVEAVEIDGTMARELIEREGYGDAFDGEMEAYMTALLQRDDAKAYFFTMPPRDNNPTGAMFIPWPTRESFEKKPDREDSPGFSFLFGIGYENRPETAPDDFERIQNGERFQGDVLDASRYEELAQNKESFVVFVDSPGCPTSVQTSKYLETLRREGDLEVPIYLDLEGTFSALVMKNTTGNVQFPTLIYHHQGRAVDFMVGAGQRPDMLLRDFFARNDLATFERPDLLVARNPEWDDATWKRRVSVYRYWMTSQMKGEDLSGVDLSRGVLAGVSLEDANLDGANFDRATITYTSFVGTSTKGATFRDASFYEVICPDGSKSSEHGESCPQFQLP